MARGSGRGKFGLTSRGRGNFRASFRGSTFRGRGRGRGGSNQPAPVRADDGSQLEEKFERVRANDEVDEKLGFSRISEGPKREGWLINMHPTLIKSEDWPSGRAGVDFYFVQDDGGMFKVTMLHEPYFYICCKTGMENSVEEWLMKKYEGLVSRIIPQKKEDLKLPNHLLGHRRLYLQLRFRNVGDLLAVRRDVVALALANGSKMDAVDAYAEVINAEAAMRVDIEGQNGLAWGAEAEHVTAAKGDPTEGIIDAREFDVPYYLRVAIDNDLRVGLWYTVTFNAGQPTLTRIEGRVKRADPVVLAFDIETTKQPLKFPDQDSDQIMMISYMIDGQGFLITNRDIVSEDIEDFEYTPREGYEGPFVIFNEEDEKALLSRFFSHIQTAKPTVIATFNGDAFDFPFVDARAKSHGLDMFLETGFAKDAEDEYKSRSCIHMDCFRWVKRDSYLPQGSQGLKAVTTAKLGYNPIELDPELMTPYATEQPQKLAQYSVSDAVATYYLYMKYVHPFIFSLCNIIPLCPDEVLRKGSGTLCETLLMVEAFRGQIIMPNRHEEPYGSMFEGHLLASETYVGGHVEALEAGVFRSDIASHFKIVPAAVQKLIDDLDAALQFCIVEESKMSLDNVTNYDEVKMSIQTALEEMRDNPIRQDKPLIYHLDVAAMYPNIMLSNRLQPDSVVDESVCAVCDYNRPGKTCDRRMTWAWRGEFFPAHRDEFNMVKHALYQEFFPPRHPNGPKRRFTELSEVEQSSLLHKRLGDYSRKVYKKTKVTKVENRQAIICQRENPFYIDTVRSFRDRRYEYKGLHKTWKKNLDTSLGSGTVAEIEEAKKMIVIYDSLQLAHKCILNSFYGYVMRKGARWHSMEMAGITCLTGARIIQMARQLVEQIGRPLELDTDGIWCMLPGIFPENFTFKVEKGKPLAFSYPCTMLNHLVHAQFTNHQYHDLVDSETGKYEVHSENSIFFELDGPYRAMILPSSKEEDKLLKKRYAVFNDDGSLAELKGFEVKRRGELQLIKIFQSQIFDKFLLGSTTEECYAAVASVADQWLDILFSKGETLADEELVELIAENRSMSKTLAEYGSQKSTSISTAKRLSEFLGNQNTKGLACKFIISAKPVGAPVTERAVPVAIFSATDDVKRKFLRKWLKDSSLANFDLRSILDWDYYIERLGSVIQKLVTIPAAMQKVPNPVPRIRHPDWLHRRVVTLDDKFQQHKLTDFFQPITAEEREAAAASQQIADIEDFGSDSGTSKHPRVASVTRVAAAKLAAPVKKPLPDPSVNYPGWIRAMRPKWKAAREARLGGSTAKLVPAMFRGVKVKSINSWDIVQIRPSNKLGRLNMWLASDSELTCVGLWIPRQFYLNLKSEPKEEFFLSHQENGDPLQYPVERASKTLPRDHPCHHLYKITVSENIYQAWEDHFSQITNNPNVDGVYEMQIPLDVRALLKLGSRCAIDKDSDMTLTRAKDIGFDLHQLDRPGLSSKKRYLNGGQSFEYIFLFHASSSTTALHVFALFYPTNRVKIHIVDPAPKRQPLPRLQEAYTALLEKYRNRAFPGSVKTYPDQLQFDTSYHNTPSAALKAISRELGLVQNRSNILVLSSAKQQSYFDSQVEKLQEFPVLLMPGTKASHSLDVLQWHSVAVQRMLSRYLGFGPWVYASIDQAIYYDLPVGNVDADQALFYADISFARRLMQQDMVLWWAPGSLPDLGGRENDGLQSAEDLVSPEYSIPGSYHNVSLSIQVRNLAVNSVLQAAVVNELEGSGGATAFDSTSHTLDEYAKGEAQSSVTLGDSALSPQTFAILKAMVKTWMLDKARSPDSPADIAIDHFWRWLSTGASKMFDPALHRFVHGLMKKTFTLLISEFKRLGSSIIYADFGRILLVTSKPPGTAAAYATYITTTVTSGELFKHIYLRTDTFYDFMAFMDIANFGAVICKDPFAIESPENTGFTSTWNIQAFLPLAVQDYFRDAVKRFILDMHQLRRRHSNSGRTPLRVLNLTQGVGIQQDTAKTQEVEAIKTFLAQKLTRRMLTAVSKILEQQRRAHLEDESPPEFDFPILPGSHLNTLTNPALEFIKFTCAVFALDKDFNLEIGLLKRSLLDLLGVREFSDEAMFRNPCDPFKLRMVICHFCTSLRDFDFCRDPDLLPSSTSRSRLSRWQCTQCSSEYDRRSIEMAMVDVVSKLVTTFQVQDMRCTKCKQLRTNNLKPYCDCSGTFQSTTASKADGRRKLRTIVNVATVHDLAMLKACAEEALRMW